MVHRMPPDAFILPAAYEYLRGTWGHNGAIGGHLFSLSLSLSLGPRSMSRWSGEALTVRHVRTATRRECPRRDSMEKERTETALCWEEDAADRGT